MAKVVYFPKGHFIRNRQRPLTPLMIKTLQRACNKQYMGISFGPCDIKGSVISLINRGLIASHIVQQKGDFFLTWYVTPHAISMLEDVGVKVSI